MAIILRLILRDSITKEIYQTPEHNDNKKKDDFHTEVKPEILKRIDKKIKDRFGKNGDIEIADGQIILVSQKVNDKTGERLKTRVKTGIDATDHFDHLGFIVMWSVYEVMVELGIDFTIKVNNIENHIREIEIKLK